ncbi:MAG: hypothetical protein P4L76_08985 [Beijerinckiaceae bacterium]|nr:hypothetical protein [Beijerinckiaceae bacterium]
MNEGRIMLCVFGVAALIMIGLPVGTIWMRDKPVSPSAALDGELSRFFLQAEPGAAPAIRDVPGVERVFPKGLPDTLVFDKIAASGFTCATDANAATCFRAFDAAKGCAADWRVRLIFSENGTLWSSAARRSEACATQQ